MTKNFKNILNRYVCLSSFISLPIWFVTSLLVNIVFESKKLALLTLVIGLINWFFVMVHFEICTSSIDNENKIGDILFSIYLTILLILSTYIVFNYGQTILNELCPTFWTFSSVGQSTLLITGWSQVRALQGPLKLSQT